MERLYTTKQVVSLFGVDLWLLNQWVQRKKVQPIYGRRLRRGRERLFTEQQAQALRQAHMALVAYQNALKAVH